MQIKMLIGGQAMEDIEWVLGLKTSRRNGNTYSKSRILSRIDSILKKLYLKKFLKIKIMLQGKKTLFLPCILLYN